MDVQRVEQQPEQNKQKLVPIYKKPPDEGDALKGKYQNEDLQNRKGQWALVPMTWDDQKEQDIDFMLRQLSIATDGMGALGEDFPITAETRNALHEYFAMYMRVRKYNRTNRLRMRLETRIRLYFHMIFDRSVSGIIPKVVLAYKPVIRDNIPGAEGSPTTDTEMQIERAQKS